MRRRSVTTQSRLDALACEIVRCTRCPRLVRWREEAALRKPRRYLGWEYWAKPVPGFGDPHARLLIVGLAPAAHGANRTGRMFTGDRSGDWLYRALYEYGFASQPTAHHRDDGLRLHDCYITAVLRCAPPENKPLPSELLQCRPFLLGELELLRRVRVVIALGRIAYDGVIKAFRERQQLIPSSDRETEEDILSSAHARRLIVPSGLSTSVPGEKTNRRGHVKPPPFAHGTEIALTPHITVLASYHPSQQNTFTGKLTRSMFHAVFGRARELLDGESLCG